MEIPRSLTPEELARAEAARQSAVRRLFPEGQEKEKQRKAAAERLLVKFRQLWYELHQYPTENKQAWNPTAAKKWLNLWEAKVPNSGCSCKQHWEELKKDFTPDFSSPQVFYNWTVAAHNQVNKRLGKPHYENRNFILSN